MSNFKTLRERIFVAFFVYAATSFLVSVTSFVLFRQMERAEGTSYRMSRMSNNVLRLLEKDDEFLVYETIDTSFYRTGESHYFRLRQERLDALSATLRDLEEDPEAATLDIDGDVSLMQTLLSDYDSLFGLVVGGIQARGFRDFGFIGMMREYVHRVEEHPAIDQTALLTIRRHEKDYLIRNDDKYAGLLAEKVAEFRSGIDRLPVPSRERRELSELMRLYEELFKEVVRIDRKTGYRNGSGMSQEMGYISDNLYHLSDQIEGKAADRKEDILGQVRFAVVLLVTISVVLTLLLSLSFQFVIKPEEGV